MRRALVFAVLLAACAASRSTPPQPPVTDPTRPADETRAASTLRYSVVVQTRMAGVGVTTITSDGVRETQFSYLDNGRGPVVYAKLRLASDGTVASFEAKGKETFGNVIDERFTRTGSRASWGSLVERGERTPTARRTTRGGARSGQLDPSRPASTPAACSARRSSRGAALCSTCSPRYGKKPLAFLLLLEAAGLQDVLREVDARVDPAE